MLDHLHHQSIKSQARVKEIFCRICWMCRNAILAMDLRGNVFMLNGMKSMKPGKKSGHDGNMYVRYMQRTKDALDRLVTNCKLTHKVDKLLQEELVAASWIWMQESFDPAVLMEFLGPRVEQIREELKAAQQKSVRETEPREETQDETPKVAYGKPVGPKPRRGRNAG